MPRRDKEDVQQGALEWPSDRGEPSRAADGRKGLKEHAGETNGARMVLVVLTGAIEG